MHDHEQIRAKIIDFWMVKLCIIVFVGAERTMRIGHHQLVHRKPIAENLAFFVGCRRGHINPHHPTVGNASNKELAQRIKRTLMHGAVVEVPNIDHACREVERRG